METDALKLREYELRRLVKVAIKISEDSCVDAFSSKTLSGDLGMQRFVFQESFKLVLENLLKYKPNGAYSYNGDGGSGTSQQGF